MSTVEDVLDFLAFLFLLGVCSAVAFGVVLPIVYENSDASEAALADKTAPSELGYKDTGSFDGTYSKLEIVLMTQVQDPQMPSPKLYYVGGGAGGAGGLSVQVNTIYRADLQPLGVASFGALSGDPATSRYKVAYDYGATSSDSDDFYQIRKQ